MKERTIRIAAANDNNNNDNMLQQKVSINQSACNTQSMQAASLDDGNRISMECTVKGTFAIARAAAGWPTDGIQWQMKHRQQQQQQSKNNQPR